MVNLQNIRRVGIVLFAQFELLDVFGPAEIFGLVDGQFELVMIGPEQGPVSSAQGPKVDADYRYREAPPCDIVLVPGGQGTREVVGDKKFLDWLGEFASGAEYVASVCTGSAVLAAAGLLDGYRATSNKRAFEWVTKQSNDVDWVRSARWVEDRNRWTSSGISAGIDMALALVARLYGDDIAKEAARHAEYLWNDEPDNDPFATT